MGPRYLQKFELIMGNSLLQKKDKIHAQSRSVKGNRSQSQTCQFSILQGLCFCGAYALNKTDFHPSEEMIFKIRIQATEQRMKQKLPVFRSRTYWKSFLLFFPCTWGRASLRARDRLQYHGVGWSGLVADLENVTSAFSKLHYFPQAVMF